MSKERDPATDQVAPTPNDRPFIQDLVIADIEKRKQHGITKYGTALQSGNGRDTMLDAYEEALDLCIYLRGVLDEDQADKKCRASIEVTTADGLAGYEVSCALLVHVVGAGTHQGTLPNFEQVRW